MSDTAVTIVETPVGDNEAVNVISSVESTSNDEELIVPDMSADDPLKDVNSSDSKLDEERNDDQSKDSSKSESGFVRPPYIPPHLMGRDLNNPALDMVGTGRRVQKPRLGVKVPYRNLTSQIVSQDEIAQEILERSLRKYSYSDVPEGGDVFFAMKLTHRLANKINNVETASEKVMKKVESKTTVDSKAVSEVDKRPKKPSIAPTLPKVTPKKDDPLFDSKAEELYAEISSTLNEDCKLPKSLKASPVPNIAPKKVINGSVVPPTEQELDNDTLLAILEGTTDLSDNTTAVVPSVSSTPPAPALIALAPVPSNPVPAVIAAISPISSPCTPPIPPKSDGSIKRKRRVRPVLDPNIEKELALKQLMDFETKRSLDRMKRVIKKPRSEEEPQNVIENKQSEGEPEKKITVKRAYSLSSAPKRFPKKYQRIIKRQLRSSKLKSKSLSPDQAPKKLPEVPEVQIAIDKYIKTYTNKRKHKPDNGNTETPNEKKIKETNSNSATTSNSVENTNAKQEIMPTETDSADENRNEADISDLEAKKSEGTPKPKANSKVMREINRLLGDEGAINMIYSIEQKRIPGNKNDASVLPSTRRKKKDLLLKTKLVKSAVLRLSMSSSQTSPGRGRRSSPEAPATVPATKVATKAPASPVRKASIESVESSTSDVNSPKTRKVPAEASKIIRRHSSSSAYSTDEDEPEKTSIANNATKESGSVTQAPTPIAGIVVPTTSAGSTSKTSEKVSVDSLKTNDAKGKSSRTSSRRTSKEDPPPIDNENFIGDHAYHASVLNGPNVEIFEQISLKEITIRKYDNLVQIIVISSSTKIKNALNADILRELTKVLLDLQKDSKCRIVLLTSTGSSFFQGIDLQALINTDKKERSKVVNEYVHALTEFTKCLSQFHKLLIAGVHGSAVGLGVTMLPFFDMVFASDKATFYTPYVKLGQIPEAGATLTLPHLLGNAVTSELIFGCRMLTASEALQFGLVTRVLWPDKFNEELLPLARSIASHSSQSMDATKKLLRQAMNARLVDQLETEAKLLQEHWCSEECQNLFKKYLEEEAMMQNK